MIYLDKPDAWNPAFEAVGCFIEYEGEIFLLHRQDHKPEGNTWCAPGGKIDTGESPLAAIIREIRQESGFDIPPDKLNYIREIYVRYSRFDFVYHLFHTEFSEKQNASINYSEHKAYCWATPEKALAMPLIQDEDVCIKLFYGIK